LSYLPLGSLYTGLGPFPWQIGGIRQLAAVPDAFAWWFLLPSLWRGLKFAAKRYGRGMLLDFLPSLAILLVLALVVANFGTTVRERMQLILLVIPVISQGWVLGQRRLLGLRNPPAVEPSQ
jgi:hypothetical protein